MPAKQSITVTAVQERTTKTMTRYSETTPGQVMRNPYIDTASLMQAFGKVPAKVIIRIEEG